MKHTEFEVQVYCEKEGDYIDAIATINHYSPEVPACLHKAPEDCYPAEGAEVDFTVTVDGKEWELSDDEYESVSEELLEDVQQKLIDQMEYDADERASEARAERMDY